MEIEEVAHILGACHFLRAPKHVFITDEPVRSKENGITFYRGLQPKHRRDVIFLSKDRDSSTPIHEAVHAQLGLGEPGTEIISRLIMTKNRVLQNFPNLQGLLQKQIAYVKTESSEDFPEAQMFHGRIEHFVRV